MSFKYFSLSFFKSQKEDTFSRKRNDLSSWTVRTNINQKWKYGNSNLKRNEICEDYVSIFIYIQVIYIYIYVYKVIYIYIYIYIDYLYTLKITENQRFSAVFRRYKMGTLARYGFKKILIESTEATLQRKKLLLVV